MAYPLRHYVQLSVIGLREWFAFPDLVLVALRGKIDIHGSTYSLH
ncbi:ATP-dependent zinc protease, partial [Pseudomonas aeruginosa]